MSRPPVPLAVRRSEPIVIRRRPVRPLVGPQERMAILLVIVACALFVRLGDHMAESVAEALSFGDAAQPGFVVDAPGE